MNPGRAIATCVAKYAVFLGRARRSEFWWWALLQVVMIAALAPLGGSEVASFWVLGTMTPTIAVAVRRMRDAGLSPLLLLLFFVPVVNVTLLYLLAVPSKRIAEVEPAPAVVAA